MLKMPLTLLRGKKIIQAAELKNLDGELIKIISDYLHNRKIQDEYGKIYEVTAGVPQGSIIGPCLWNLLYDGVLKLKMPDGIKLIAYADDLAVICVAKREKELMYNMNRALKTISTWMSDNGLEIAANKTEAVLLIGRKKHSPIQFKIDNQIINPQETVKYLGVVFDRNLSFAAHIKQAVEKANKAVKNLSILLPKTHGPEEGKRRILGHVAQSVVLYGVEAWYKALEVQKYRLIIERLQRRICLLINRGYRTIGLESARVISGVIPFKILVEERLRGQNKNKKENRDVTLNDWQKQWSEYTGSGWTKMIINNIKTWVERKHGGSSYHITQFLSGHGCFMKYLYAIKKVQTPYCLYCEEEEENTAEHTFFRCHFWKIFHERANKKIKCEITTENVMDKMVETEENWKIIKSWIEEVLKRKEEDQRRKERSS